MSDQLRDGSLRKQWNWILQYQLIVEFGILMAKMVTATAKVSSSKQRMEPGPLLGFRALQRPCFVDISTACSNPQF